MKVALTDTRTGAALFSRRRRVSPDKPFTIELLAPAKLTLYDLRLTVSDKDGKGCSRSSRRSPARPLCPRPRRRRPIPRRPPRTSSTRGASGSTVSCRSPEALAYYREALRRDPKDVRVNVELGGIALKETRWADALKQLDAALERDPANARAQFGRGMAFVGLGDFAEAEDAFSRASLGADQQAAAELALGRLALRRGDTRGALVHLQTAGARNGLLADVPALRAAALRLAGEHDNALAAAEEALALDAMHFMAGREKALTLTALGRPANEWNAQRTSFTRGSVQNAIELATAYLQAGLAADADAVLAEAGAGRGPTSRRPASPPGAGARWSTTCAASSPSSAATPPPPGSCSRRAPPARSSTRTRTASRSSRPSRPPRRRTRRTLTRSTCWATCSTAWAAGTTGSRTGSRPWRSTGSWPCRGGTSPGPSGSCTRTTAPRPRRTARRSPWTRPTRACCSSSTRRPSGCARASPSARRCSTPTAPRWRSATTSRCAGSTSRWPPAGRPTSSPCARCCSRATSTAGRGCTASTRRSWTCTSGWATSPSRRRT